MPLNESSRERTARLRREAQAAREAFQRGERVSPFGPYDPLTDPAYRPGSDTRPDLYPDRWVYQNPDPTELAEHIRNRINGRDVRMSFNVEVKPDSALKRRYEELTPNVYVLGARINKAALLDLLSRLTLARVVETIRGYPLGTILNVTEVSIAEAWNG